MASSRKARSLKGPRGSVHQPEQTWCIQVVAWDLYLHCRPPVPSLPMEFECSQGSLEVDMPYNSSLLDALLPECWTSQRGPPLTFSHEHAGRRL